MTDYIEAHKFSSNNKEALQNDKKCGCFYCLKIFDPKEINFWIKDNTETAVCPYCCIDSVIGESSGLQLLAQIRPSSRAQQGAARKG